jgi:hypothetical protein
MRAQGTWFKSDLNEVDLRKTVEVARLLDIQNGDDVFVVEVPQ